MMYAAAAVDTGTTCKLEVALMDAGVKDAVLCAACQQVAVMHAVML